MKSQPVLIFIAILTLLAVISLPLTHASTRAERKKRAGRKLRRTKDSAARPPRGARWKGYKLLAEKSGIVQWHVENNSKVNKNDHLLTIQWTEEQSDGDEAEFEELIVALWPGQIRIRNLRNCGFSEATKTLLSIEPTSS